MPVFFFTLNRRTSPARSTMLSGSRKPTVIEELEQEMKLLHWHKLANEAALKAALIRSKRMKAKDNPVIQQSNQQQERALWVQKTLEEEQQKPLQVTDDFVKGHKEREARDEQRLASEVSLVRLCPLVSARHPTPPTTPPVVGPWECGPRYHRFHMNDTSPSVVCFLMAVAAGCVA